MPAKTCPACQLVHPASAPRCECGYDFIEEKSPRLPGGHHRRALPWHEEPLVAIAGLLFCWPAGLFLIAQNKHMSSATKSAVVSVWFALFVGVAIYKMSLARGSAAP